MQRNAILDHQVYYLISNKSVNKHDSLLIIQSSRLR